MSNADKLVGDDADQTRLRETISDEIHAVMTRHGVGGAVFLVSEDAASWRFVMPAWSGLQPEMPSGGLRLRINSKTPEAQKRADSTMHLIASLRDMANDCREVFGQVFRQAKRALDDQGASIEHRRGNRIDPHGGKRT